MEAAGASDYERVKTAIVDADNLMQNWQEGKFEGRFSQSESTNLTNFDENFIHMLIKYGKLEVIMEFITELAKENKAKLVEMLNQQNRVGWLPIYYAPQHKSVELMKLLHELDKTQVKHKCNNGSVLIRATEVASPNRDGSSLRCLKFLTEDCKLNVNEPDNEGCTPIYMACFKYNYEIVKYLIENEADPSILCTSGSTCFHVCAERDFLDLLQLLCAKRADLIFGQDDEGNTPLHIAALWSHMEILEFLWEEGGRKLASIKNSDGLTAMELAYEENQLQPHEYLCEKMGVKPNSL
mmetsp:Transcript_26100/g.30129  ORF Transcript_26100/g.30129 Transcript_26100/m.30129 type:complete len:296 (-) Transcript_26100:69-956(-)